MVHQTKLSSGFRTTIPKAIRQQLGINAGQTLYVFERDGQIRFVRHRVEVLRGMCRGMKWKREDRDHSERF